VQEVTIREGAPNDLRVAIVMLAEGISLNPSSARDAACSVLLKKPDPRNWTEYPNVFQEVQWLVEN
jgi:hypothetical protein